VPCYLPEGGRHTFVGDFWVSTKVALDEQLDSSSSVRFSLHSIFSAQVRKQYFIPSSCATHAEVAGQSASLVQPDIPQYPPLNCVKQVCPSWQSSVFAHCAPTPKRSASVPSLPPQAPRPANVSRTSRLRAAKYGMLLGMNVIATL